MPTIAATARVAEPSTGGPGGGGGEVPVAAPAPSVAADVPTNGLPGSVLIDEVLYDPPAPLPDPDGEWLVLRNASGTSITLRGWAVRDGNTSSFLPTTQLVAGGRVLVLSAEADGVQGVGADVLRVSLDGRIGNGLRNDGDGVWLVDGAGRLIDGVSWGDDTSAFDPAVPLVEGRSIRRIGPQDTDSAQDWIDNRTVVPTPDGPTVTPRVVVPNQPLPLSPDQSLGATPDAPQTIPSATIAVPTQQGGGISVATVVASAAPLPVQAANVGGASIGNLIISEVAPDGGWVEIYNRGPEVVDVSDWTLVDGTTHPGVVLQSAVLLPAHGFVVFDVPELNMIRSGQRITLRRPDGMTADSVTVGPVEPQRSWSRYPVHGGLWTANTTMSRGQFNQPGPEPTETTVAEDTTPTLTPTPPPVVQDSITGFWANTPSMIIWVLSILVVGPLFFLLRRRR